MKLLVNLLMCAGFIYILVIIVKEIVRSSKSLLKYLKERENLDIDDRTLFESLAMVIAFVGAIYLIDQYNLFSVFKLSQNLTKDYDWLSFIGATISVVISTIALIVVTRKERKENNKIVRESQRPYLTSIFKIFDNDEITKISDETYRMSNEFDDGVSIPCLKITNAGETVAIIDTQESYVKIKYEIIKKIKNGKSKLLQKEKIISINCVTNRLAIAANHTIYVCFDDEEFNIPLLIEKIKIRECYIMYRDLFGYIYEDKSILNNNLINVEIDNRKKEKLDGTKRECKKINK